jgi:exonuclease SbcC
MIKISEILAQLKYEYKVETKVFMNNNIEIYTTYKYLNNEDKKIVAKYLVINFLDIQFDLLLKNFDSFQKNIIADIFYSHRDDIRWNIYAFIIVENKNFISKEIDEIEKDENYARKFIFEIDELKDFLVYGFFGQINSKKKTSIKTNFVLEWDNYLNEHSLNGCIHNKMNSNSIEEYIVNAKPIRPIGRPNMNQTASTSEDTFVIHQINKLHFSNYRTHCFNSEFTYSPSLVNLISGSNGSGKSSICEAIALGMSGISKSDDVIKVFCENNKGDEVVLSSKKTAKDSRELDLTWYGTTTTGSKSRLIENFAIFNYMQPNAIYSNNNRDLNELLQNLIYGEETTQSWKNIQNYYEKFNTLKRTWKNQKQELKNEVVEIEKKISEVNLEELSFETLFDDKFNFLSEIPVGYKLSEKLNMLDSLQYSVSILDKDVYALEKVKTFGDILKKFNNLVLKKDEIHIDKEKNENIEKEISNIKIRKSLNLSQYDKLAKLKTEYGEIGRNYVAIDHITIDSQSERDKFIYEYHDKKSKCNKLKSILNEFEKLRYYEGKSDPGIDAMCKEASLSYQNLLKKHDEVKQSLSEKLNNSDLTKKILTDIFRFAKDYQLLHKDNSKCPLCGNDFMNSAGLEDAINNTALLKSNFDSEMEIIILQEQELSKKIQDKKSELQNMEIRKIKNNEINEFIEQLEKIDIKFNITDVIDLFMNCDEILNSLEDFLSKNKRNIEFINEMENKDIYFEFNKQFVINSFSTYLKNKQESTEAEMFENLKEKSWIEKELSRLEADLVTKELTNKRYEEINVEISLYKELISCVNDIKSVFKTIEDIFDIKEWCISFYNLKKVFEENLKREKDDIYKKSLLNNFNKKKEEFFIAEARLERCEKAITAFESLSSLEDNMSQFIMENAKRIERIFKMIHRPEEFTDLVIEEGIIKFVRKSTKETIDISNISTGQALSLVFAVTLCLHFSAKNAPNFLMFDEPVANLDDVHIMNLVDMLKEISLMGVQLFITTANDQVATYFRRKFSCLTDDFKHLDIRRTDEKPSIFTEKIYSPYKEAANSIRLVAV